MSLMDETIKALAKAPRRKDMSHTQGKIQLGSTGIKDVIILGPSPSKKYIANVVIEQISGGAIAEVMESEREGNAKHIVHCWNAFEEDGLVTKLLNACKRGQTRLLEMGQKESHRTLKILKAAIDSAESQ